MEALAGKVYRLRVVGSIAISLAYVAAGSVEQPADLRSCRSVDAAAAQLIVREAGVVAFDAGGLEGADLGLESADLGLDARYPMRTRAGERGLSVPARRPRRP